VCFVLHVFCDKFFIFKLHTTHVTTCITNNFWGWHPLFGTQYSCRGSLDRTQYAKDRSQYVEILLYRTQISIFTLNRSFFVVKRYAVCEAKTLRYAVRKAKKGWYAVRKWGGGVTLISYLILSYLILSYLILLLQTERWMIKLKWGVANGLRNN